jgi:hypothetical protein
MSSYAQYPPQAGLAGSTAIGATSSQFVGWATHCDVYRGFMDIANPSLGYVTAGDSSFAIGMADGSVVSLGDSGVAVLTFNGSIYNGLGADFAVFENGFRNPADSEEAFLELAYVEVSSDGINFFRFPSTSLTQDTAQIAGSGTYMNARKLNNLAGKYIGGYGTPFDLQELANTVGLDINHVTHVRIVDVIGSINGHSCTDDNSRKINDPYPTAFPTGGFDLDAVGVINGISMCVHTPNNEAFIHIYPNPATDNITVSINNNSQQVTSLILTDIIGKELMYATFTSSIQISLSTYPRGMYYLKFKDTNSNQWVEKVTKL